MADVATDFQKRVSRLARKKARLEHGYVAVVGKDGLIVTKPTRVNSGFPFRIFALLIVGFFAFKILLISHLGPAAYEQRVDALRDGTLIEQAGAFALQIDPISQVIANKIIYSSN